ncbi:MAG TPA: hypothetical protein PLV83_00890 [Bacilli bacterium]|nr:hypothetical protein [Bacilli bacterium]
MNNKGFGLAALLAFIVFAGVVLVIFYIFCSDFLESLFARNNKVTNYKNEYIIYMKEHNISLEK